MLLLSPINVNDEKCKFSDGLRLLERWYRGFESHSRHGCLCAFILCLSCSVCR
jgi:hypothetical protein